jgi:hypothetical protein
MLDLIRDIFYARRDESSQFDGTISFDVKLIRVDSHREDILRSFRSREERDAFVDGFLSKPGKSKQIDQVVYEDTLIFFRRQSADDLAPSERPELEGAGELLLRVHGSRETVLEANTSIKMEKIAELFSKQNYGSIDEMSILRRQVVFERRSVLVKLSGEVPASALKIESAEYQEE